MAATLKYLPAVRSETMKLKALDDGSVYIEGWANKSVVDRGKDLIPKKAWKTDNYKKNPIVLFNHNHDMPIGKMMAVEPREEGLFIKGRIAKSNNPQISMIRDLIQEGILNSMSVGIMVDDEEQKDGVNMIKSAELHEVSIVAVPMNQDSQFELSTKSLTDDIAENLDMIASGAGYQDVARACRLVRKKAKGLPTVASVADELASLAGVSKEYALNFLKMREQTTEQLDTWLKAADSEDCTKDGEKAQGSCEEDPMKKEEKAQLGDGNEVFAIKVPKSAFASMEELMSWADQSGWSCENMTEDEENYTLIQRSQDQFSGDMTELDMGDGVTAIVGKLAAQSTDEETSESNESPEEEQAEGEEKTSGQNKEEKGLLDGQNPMTQPIEGADASDSEVNPALDQAKQTNVLLASAVQALQTMNEKLDQMMQLMAASYQQEVSEENTETVSAPVEDTSSAEEMKLLKTLDEFMQSTAKRLNQLGL